jgi:hypothetical protein
MGEVFLIGDDASVSIDSVEIASAQSVEFNKSRTDITSAARGSDRMAHRGGKLDVTMSIDVRVEPGDAGLAALLSAVDSNSVVQITVTSEDGDTLEDANFVVLDTTLDQPLEEEQTGSFDLAFHSELGS